MMPTADKFITCTFEVLMVTDPKPKTGKVLSALQAALQALFWPIAEFIMKMPQQLTQGLQVRASCFAWSSLMDYKTRLLQPYCYSLV